MTGTERTGDPSKPRYSVLLASRDEGDRLLRTVKDLVRNGPADALEVIIVDDASDDGSVEHLGVPGLLEGGLRVVRNDTPRGLIFSRARAAELARGRYLAFLDAHCAVSPGWLSRLAAHLRRIGDRGIVTPVIHSLEPEAWAVDRASPPAAACTIDSPFLDFVWTQPRVVDRRVSSCVMGGGAWMCSREWYRHIGGLDRGMVSWGGENIDIPLRTWGAGGWCLVAEDVRVGHLYKDSPTSPASPSDVVSNKIRAAHNALTRRTFERVMFSLVYLEGFEEALRRVLEDREEIARLKRCFERRRRRSDAWLIRTFRLPLLEPPLFHRPFHVAVRAGYRPPRPPVGIVVPPDLEEGDRDRLIASVRETTTYGNYEILDGARAEDASSHAGQVDLIAFISAGARILDPHWIERFVLLFQRRRRLLLACPRTRWLPEDEDADAGGEDGFDVLWDWDAPRFSRQRTGRPLADVPYQAFSCPDTLLFVHGKRFLELGGFDPVVPRAGCPALDLAIRGWLYGFEVFCHPGVTLGRRSGRGGAAVEPATGEAAMWGEFAQVLPAVTYFTDERRIDWCRRRSPLAEPLLREHRRPIQERRSRFLARAKFDEGWLFYKFQIEDAT